MVSVGNNFIVRTGKNSKFWCFECLTVCDYTRRDMHEYFCFCGIPLFSHGIVSSAIHCTGCNKDFSLRGMTDEQLGRTRKLVAEWLKNRSIEQVTKLLKDWRIPEKQFQRLLGLAIGDTVRRCPKCAQSFAALLHECPDCRKILSNPGPYKTGTWDMSGIVTWTQKPQR